MRGGEPVVRVPRPVTDDDVRSAVETALSRRSNALASLRRESSYADDMALVGMARDLAESDLSRARIIVAIRQYLPY